MYPTHPEDVEEEDPPKLSPTSDALVPNQPSSSPMPFTGVGQDTKNVVRTDQGHYKEMSRDETNSTILRDKTKQVVDE
jgi:hypothetical protein